MKNKPTSNPNPDLESRVATLEDNVKAIADTLYDLIQVFQQIPQPPCPPMCEAQSSGKPYRKKASKS